MTFTDKEVQRWIKQLKTPEVRESLEEYPENERDGRSDIQVFADEVSYGISCFNEGGHAMNEALEEAQNLIRITKNGRVFPFNEVFFGELPTSADLERAHREVEEAREIVAEYRQLCNRMKKLNERGIHGEWEGR